MQTTSVCEQELIDAIGVEDTIKLEIAFSSSYLYIGAKAPSKAIVEAVGIETGMRLVEYFGCGDIWVPRTMLTKKRNNEIEQEHSTGKTLIELAAKFELSIQRVHKILRERGINA